MRVLPQRPGVTDPLGKVLRPRQVHLGAIVFVGAMQRLADGVQRDGDPGGVGQSLVAPQALAQRGHRGVEARTPHCRRANLPDAIRGNRGLPVGRGQRAKPRHAPHQERITPRDAERAGETLRAGEGGHAGGIAATACRSQ